MTKEPTGWIKLWRKIDDSEIMKMPPLYLKVFIWMLISAKYEAVNGLKRSQLRTSINEIRNEMSYYAGYRKHIPTYREVRSILEWLRKPHGGQSSGTMIVTAKVTHGVIVTICNYDKYQPKSSNESQDGSHDENSTECKHVSQLEERSNKKEEKKKEKKKKKPIMYADDFLLFWKEYPNATGKGYAFESWEKLSPDNELVNIIIEAVKNQVRWRDNLKANERAPFWKNPSTWLNGRCWEDKIPEPQGKPIQYHTRGDKAKTRKGFPDEKS